MWLMITTCLVFAGFISSGLSSDKPSLLQPFDCLLGKRGCEGHSDCPASFPVCEGNQCCRAPVFPPICPLNRRGPKCGLAHPLCKPGYTCKGGYCCRDELSLICPVDQRGPICGFGQPLCKSGYTCRGGYCCRDEILPICPLYRRGPSCGFRYPPCKLGYTCLSGYCCRDLITSSCPINLRGPRCGLGHSQCKPGYTCRDGYCCRVLILPIERCPAQRPGLMCPAVFLPPRCHSDADCTVGKKCCVVGCGPADCVTPVSGPILPPKRL